MRAKVKRREKRDKLGETQREKNKKGVFSASDSMWAFV